GSDLEIIPVINKIDMPAADPERVTAEIVELLGIPAEEVLQISAKSGLNVEAVLEAVVQRVPPPKGDPEKPLRALIFDSHYDTYKGVVAYVRIVDGRVQGEETLRLMATNAEFKPIEVGSFTPRLTPGASL